jgi:RNA polymerase sigma factor (sigma-70 family)
LLFESVVNALAELTPAQRLAFLLRHYEGMSYEEIATAMNCSIWNSEEGSVARDWKTARAAFAGIRRTGDANESRE